MRIAHLNTFYSLGGAAQAARRIIEAIQLFARPEIQFINHFNDKNGIYSFRNLPELIRLSFDKLRTASLLKIKEDKFKFDLAEHGKSVSSRTALRRADIIHFHWICQGFVSMNELERILQLSRPVIWTMHDMWPFTGGCFHAHDCGNFQTNCGNCPLLKDSGPEDQSYQLWVRKKNIYSKAALNMVSPSRWLMEKAELSSLAEFFNVHHIPNPINLNRYVPISRENLHPKYRLRPETFYILFAAHNIQDANKGLSFLLAALNEIRIHHPGIAGHMELILAGKNPDPRPLTECGVKINARGEVKNEEEMINLMNLANVLVLTSRSENLPNAAIEAMACETPVIAFNVGGVREIVDHEENGFLVDFGDVKKLASYLIEAYNQPGLLEKFRKSARDKISRHFSYEVVAPKYYNLYESVLK